ncbi:MAG: indolepyruvate ferredoxin oxidoreductase subunit alpha [Acidobacteriota bacterium]|nr:MAG: indolepyruvate ferredoxin oxidoreductase subunit alpha [Acidobacteriota bacterium]
MNPVNLVNLVNRVKKSHAVLSGRPGTSSCLLGNIAIVRGALEAGVQFVSGYPGTPASEIGDTFAAIAHDVDVFFEYSVNEKIAVEIAFAASLAGARSLCSMKHVGLSYAGDPISTIPYVGVGGGMVIVSAGDPSAITSPNEQDQRHYSRFLYYPVFDPATPEDAKNMTRYAFEFSEKTRLPVLLRPTTRVCHTSGMVRLGPLPETKNELRFVKDPDRNVPIPSNVRRMRQELSARFELAERLLAETAFFPRTGSGKHGIVAGGVPYTYVDQVIRELGLEEEVSVLKIGAYPIPGPVLSEFLASVESALVVEELTPFIEDSVTLSAFRNRRQIPILGKHTGHFPEEYEYSPDLVEDAVRKYLQMESRPKRTLVVPDLPARPPVLCAGCSHRTSFYLTRKVFGKKTVYCNDIGCYTLGYGEPLESCDTVLCMGSSISQASGIARTTGERTVAYIGDSTFFHSGLPALVNAVQANDPVTVVILNNYVTGMTGFQPSPALRIEDAVRGLGVETVLSADPFDEEVALDALKTAKAGDGTNVVVFNAACVVNETKLGVHEARPAYVVDPELCNSCSLCVRVLGCPAIFVEDGRYVIDAELCDGCDLCANVCTRGAIHAVSEHAE